LRKLTWGACLLWTASICLRLLQGALNALANES